MGREKLVVGRVKDGDAFSNEARVGTLRSMGVGLRLRKRQFFGLSVAIAAGMACSPVVEEPLGSSRGSLGEERVRSSEQATVTSPMELFQVAIDAGAIVAGTTAIYLGDRVEVKKATTGFAPISNTGPGTTSNFITQLGPDAKTGTIWSRTKVDLRDRAHVHGPVRTNRPVTRGNQVIIDEGIVTGAIGATKDILDPLPSLTVRGTNPLVILPGQDVNLEPGSYGSVQVLDGGTLRLDPEIYSFQAVTVEWGGKIVTKSDCSPATLEARSGFTFRGTVLEDGGNDPGIGLIVRYEGTATSYVESAFRGVIVAPKAEINLGARAHEGRFFGKVVRAQASATIKDFVPSSPGGAGCGSLGTSGPGPDPVPIDIGPAPPLTSPADLDVFLAWFYLIVPAEKAEAEAKIQAVSPGSGIREAVIQRFETARSTRAFGKALMLLAMLGALRDVEVRTFLIDLLNQPVSGLPDPYGAEATPYDDEVSYRRQALYILNAYGSPATIAVVLNVAKTHPVDELRSAAIQTLRYQKTTTEIEALRAELRPEDEFYLDLPRRSSPSFEADSAAFFSKYSN